MLSVKEIRNDLREIKFYYARKEMFEKASDSVGENQIMKKAKIYNQVVCSAPPRLYDLYVSIYLNNNLQYCYSDNLGYSTEYISRENTKLIKFFQENLKKGDFE